MEREEWLASRSTFIGASEIHAVVLGDACKVYLRKLGLAPPEEDNERMFWGRMHEPTVASVYALRTGRKLVEPGYTVFRHPEYPWCGATPDRLVEGEPRLVECKTADWTQRDGWGEPGTDSVPDAYLLQAHWQMLACTRLGIEEVDIPVLIGGNDFRIYTVRRHPEAQARLLQMAAEFWRLVENRMPPAIDCTQPGAVDLLNLLYRPTPGTSVELGNQQQADVDCYVSLGEQINALQKERDAARARLIEAMREFETGLLPDGRQVSRKVVHIAAHHREASEQVRITVKKARRA